MSKSIESTLDALMDITGAKGCSVVDYTSGMVLGSKGGGVDLELASAGNTEVVRAKLKTMESLGIEGSIDDILITLETQIHIIRLCKSHDDIFIYLVLDNSTANLALARRKVVDLEKDMSL